MRFQGKNAWELSGGIPGKMCRRISEGISFKISAQIADKCTSRIFGKFLKDFWKKPCTTNGDTSGILRKEIFYKFWIDLYIKIFILLTG